MFFKKCCVLVLWTKVDSALEGFIFRYDSIMDCVNDYLQICGFNLKKRFIYKELYTIFTKIAEELFDGCIYDLKLISHKISSNARNLACYL